MSRKLGELAIARLRSLCLSCSLWIGLHQKHKALIYVLSFPDPSSNLQGFECRASWFWITNHIAIYSIQVENHAVGLSWCFLTFWRLWLASWWVLGALKLGWGPGRPCHPLAAVRRGGGLARSSLPKALPRWAGSVHQCRWLFPLFLG